MYRPRVVGWVKGALALSALVACARSPEGPDGSAAVTTAVTPAKAEGAATAAPSQPVILEPTPEASQPEGALRVGEPRAPTSAQLIEGLAGPVPPLPEVRVERCEFRLCLRERHQQYLLDERASELHEVKRTKDGYLVSYEWNAACNAPKRTRTISDGEINARLLNAVAFRSYQAGDFASAITGFATACKLDPQLFVAKTNLASALTKAGRLDDAIGVLMEPGETLSLRTRMKILEDADLNPLAAHPRLVATNAKLRGNTSFTLKPKAVLDGGVVVSEEKQLLALVSTHESWGTEQSNEDLDLFDLRTGARLERLRFWSMAEGKPEQVVFEPKLQRRTQLLARVLSELGLSKLPSAQVHTAANSPNGGWLFPKQRVGVTTSDRLVRTFRDAELLSSHPVQQQLYQPRLAPLYLEKYGLLIVQTHMDEPEGCDAETEIATTAVVRAEL